MADDRSRATLWFAGQPGSWVIFRVNRRPLQVPRLTTPEAPDDVLNHFRGMLAPGWPVTTGKNPQRVWRIGGVQVDDDVLTGRLGWQPLGEEEVADWSEEEKDWVSTVESTHGGRVLPFGFDAETRLLAVLAEPRGTAATVAVVFESVLQENEDELGEEASTDWSVEPVLDRRDFLSWLKKTDVVERVGFTAKLPNPEPRDAFSELYERMQARRADSFTEEMRSTQETGLTGIEKDKDFSQAIIMGEHGFAQLRGSGTEDGKRVSYNQNSRVARVGEEEMPADWASVRALVARTLKTKIRRFVNDDDSDAA